MSVDDGTFVVSVANSRSCGEERHSIPYPYHRTRKEMIRSDDQGQGLCQEAFTSADVEVAKATVMSDRKFILGVVKELNLPGDNPFEGFNKLLARNDGKVVGHTLMFVNETITPKKIFSVERI